MTESSGKIRYHGNCHCGKYRFELLMPEITSGMECTCRQCKKKGYRWVAVSGDSLTVVKDDGSLRDYNSGVLIDKFCQSCGNGVTGVHSSGPLKGQTLVNINLLMELNPFKVGATTVNTDESKPSLPALPTADSPAVQHGSCTCGQVRIETLYRVQDKQIKSDNCSLCSRLAFVGSYETKDVVRIHGKENTFEYLWNAKMGGPAMCKTCGVYMFWRIYGPPISFFDKLPPERLPIVMDNYAKNMNVQPVSVRMLDDVEMETLKIDHDDCGTEGYTLDN
ncbi:Mss4-like protein [Akanthomyces lecanii RCEF 1005]|uniref:Mss4-like protein n=1 Tax=Akanthomyces lecanii RCEF 1005 TaxID=1081108 RepID=A0A168FEU2_CORDF|nr:Mss4-like protein [Akanthomyces lecanii RCEF 1005]